MVTPAAVDPSPAKWYQRVAWASRDPVTVPRIGSAVAGLVPGASAARTPDGTIPPSTTTAARRSETRSSFICSSASTRAAQPARLNLHAARIIGFPRTIFYRIVLGAGRQQIVTHSVP